MQASAGNEERRTSILATTVSRSPPEVTEGVARSRSAALYLFLKDQPAQLRRGTASAVIGVSPPPKLTGKDP
jgi:hypothetical protein